MVGDAVEKSIMEALKCVSDDVDDDKNIEKYLLMQKVDVVKGGLGYFGLIYAGDEGFRWMCYYILYLII